MKDKNMCARTLTLDVDIFEMVNPNETTRKNINENKVF